jgi:hypothetical protein
MVALIDLDSVPSVSRREVGIETATYLMDIFGRIDRPDPESVPDEEELEREGTESNRITGTPLRIVRIAEGDREGEYLFSASTVQAASRFLRGLMDRPLRTRLDIESYSAFSPQLTGPLIPAAMVRGMPGPLKGLWLGTPVWKILAIGLSAAVLAVGIVLLQRMLQARAPVPDRGGDPSGNPAARHPRRRDDRPPLCRAPGQYLRHLRRDHREGFAASATRRARSRGSASAPPSCVRWTAR